MSQEGKEWDGTERRLTHDDRLLRLEIQMAESLDNQKKIKTELETMTLLLSKYDGFMKGVVFLSKFISWFLGISLTAISVFFVVLNRGK